MILGATQNFHEAGSHLLAIHVQLCLLTVGLYSLILGILLIICWFGRFLYNEVNRTANLVSSRACVGSRGGVCPLRIILMIMSLNELKGKELSLPATMPPRLILPELATSKVACIYDVTGNCKEMLSLERFKRCFMGQ